MPRGEGAAPRAPFLQDDIEPCSYKNYIRTSSILVQEEKGIYLNKMNFVKGCLIVHSLIGSPNASIPTPQLHL